jgi:hypothetical protein
MFCSKCGKQILENSNFCAFCGAPRALPVGTESLPPRRRSRKWLGVVAGLSLFVLVCALASVPPRDSVESNESGNISSTPPRNDQTHQAAGPASEDYRYAHFADGMHIVGGDIEAGTYRTRSGSAGCYYARLAGFGGSLSETLANEDTDAPAVVSILPTDKGFKSSGCGTWTKDLSAITVSRTSFENGIFIVGTDIDPGTYRTNGASGCYYARLSGFTGSMDDTLANEDTDAPAIVTILPTDRGFKSSGCGTWTKIQ